LIPTTGPETAPAKKKKVTKPKAAKKPAKAKAPKKAKAAKKAKAPKKAKAAKAAKSAGKSRGNPLFFPDKTMVRMPAGWLKKLNATAKAKGYRQGFALRKLIGGFIGEKAAA